jgi:hypothetical protein
MSSCNDTSGVCGGASHVVEGGVAPDDQHGMLFCPAPQLLTHGADTSMTEKKTANETAPTAVAAKYTDNLKRTLKKIGGSRFDEWNNILALQTVEAIWKHSDSETQEKQFSAALEALVGIGPKDELEGMMTAQLIAAHNAAMECYRRIVRRAKKSPSPASE